ncbi:MAG: PDC sensor domain-containing protein [Chitinispirillaceae bacterium]|nr:PDC sensor domain-containing protein [Chitinispirillaceae bacterium]
MMKLHETIKLPLFLTTVFFLFSSSFSASSSLQEDLNFYFVKVDEAFARIVESGALRSTNLRSAERLFIREMRKNQAYNTFIRTNSKGSVISEVIRAQKVERPMRDISDQRWFKMVSQKKEAYYSLIKDGDKGRYYLFWARPILKKGDRFIGSVLLKIDLWDSFHEFSSSIFNPFLIKLGRKSLFSHKWEEGTSGNEKPLTIQGIDRISVVYSSESTPRTAVAPKDTSAKVLTVADTAKAKKADNAAKKKKGASGILVFLLVILILGIVSASFMLIAWMKRRAFLKRLDEEDSL